MASGLKGGLTDYGDAGFAAYLRRSFASSMGYSRAMLEKPVVGIAYTPSGFNNCHRHFPELLEALKRGVLAAGGLPLEFPTISLGESFTSPTTLKFRNLMAMDTEEMIRAQPMDAVVLMGGCDKTVPAQLMGAISADKPAVALLAGPMLGGSLDGERLGACTDCRRFWARFRAGDIDQATIDRVEGQLARRPPAPVRSWARRRRWPASTEAMGLCLPGTCGDPGGPCRPAAAAEATGALAVELAGRDDRRPSQILDEASLHNALTVLLALGGSTNAVLHLTAIAGRMGVDLDLAAMNALSAATPVLVNLKPTGQHYMEDFHRAGGLRCGAAGAASPPARRRARRDRRDAGPAARRRTRRLGRPCGHRRPRPADRPGRRTGCRVRLARAQRGRSSNARQPSALAGARRARRGLHLARRPRRPHRRSGTRRRAGRRAGPPARRPEQRRGDARGRLSADPEEAGRPRRQGHVAHLRRPHERHCLWRNRPARGAGCRRRAARWRWSATATACA